MFQAEIIYIRKIVVVKKILRFYELQLWLISFDDVCLKQWFLFHPHLPLTFDYGHQCHVELQKIL